MAHINCKTTIKSILLIFFVFLWGTVLEANPIGILAMDLENVEPFGPELIFAEADSIAFVQELSHRTFLELTETINIINSRMTDDPELWQKYLRIILEYLQ